VSAVIAHKVGAESPASARLDAVLSRVEQFICGASVPELQAVGSAPQLADVAQTLAAEAPLEETLARVVALAVATIPGCDYAGISSIRPGKGIDSPAATDDIVLKCDAAQYDLNEGPCLDAIWQEPTRLIDDMATDGQWPRFAARASGLGVGSLLAAQLDTGRGSIGALNLYAVNPHSFTEQSRSIAAAFAAHAAVALASAQREAHLRTAVESRQAIGQAVGMLMERHRLAADAAFDLLVSASQRSSMKLRDIAARVVEMGPGALS
jgi:GAF domain-containing protein